jgi:ankyrin repeat protein
MKGHPAIAKLLLEHGANVNEQDAKGQTPLFLAANLEIVELLIKFGADVNLTSNDGFSPIVVFQKKEDYVNMAKKLLENGAFTNVANIQGELVLHSAVVREELELIKALIAHNADKNALDSLGYSAAALAAIYGQSEIWAFLMDVELNDTQTPIVLTPNKVAYKNQTLSQPVESSQFFEENGIKRIKHLG